MAFALVEVVPQQAAVLGLEGAESAGSVAADRGETVPAKVAPAWVLVLGDAVDLAKAGPVLKLGFEDEPEPGVELGPGGESGSAEVLVPVRIALGLAGPEGKEVVQNPADEHESALPKEAVPLTASAEASCDQRDLVARIPGQTGLAMTPDLVDGPDQEGASEVQEAAPEEVVPGAVFGSEPFDPEESVLEAFALVAASGQEGPSSHTTAAEPVAAAVAAVVAVAVVPAPVLYLLG